MKDSSFGNTHYDYGFRIYNLEIGKFLSVNPLTKSYPELTPYQFASNTPILAIDFYGLEKYIYYQKLAEENGKSYIKKVYSHTKEGFINQDGVFEKYTDETWELRNYLGFETQVREFLSEQDMMSWDSKKNFLDIWRPLPNKTKDDILYMIIGELGGVGAREDMVNAGLTLMSIYEYKKLKKANRIAVVVGSFREMENALKYADELLELNPESDIRVLMPEEPNEFYRVISDDYHLDELPDALESRNNERESGIKDAWILVTP